MSLRYFIEALSFVALLLLFQIYIQAFINDVSVAIEEMGKYQIIRGELVLRGLPAYGFDYFEEPENSETLEELE